MSQAYPPIPPQATVPSPPLSPSKDERTMAMLAHVLQLFGGFIPPLIILLVRLDSPFVKFHSLQALIWKLVEMVLMFLGIMIFVVIMVTTIASHADKTHVPGVFILFPFIWIFMGLMWIINLVIAIYFGIKAHEGAWAEYPVIGAIARKWARV
jgi:uncharacterized protein